MKINPEIFRGYDIRGIAETDVTPEVMTILGKTYATFLFQRQIKECVVGMDNRLTSEVNKKAFVDALLESGIDVIDIGLSLTQIVYFAQYHYLSKGAAMITASHNPADYNGLKLATGFSDTLITEEIQEIKEIAQSGKFKTWPKPGTYKKDVVVPAYHKDIFKRVPLHDAGFKVIFDGCNATPSAFMPDILRKAGCEVIEQNSELDGNFPSGTPDPTELEVMERLAKRVREEKADMGLTYDADGDRMGVVNQDGTPLWNDTLVALFAMDIINFLPGSPIVFNALCSKATSDAITEAGGKPVMWLTGHSFIKAKVKESRAPFGGELSGHFFFMDNFFGHDDGAFATLRLLSYLKRTKQTLKEAMEKIPKYVSSPEIKFGLADKIKFQLIDNEITKDIKELFPNAKYVDIDGIRADTKDEMVIIRASQNGPYVTVKFEGKTQEQYDNLKKEIKRILSKYKEIDWGSGSNTDALD
jgi:phosphomannomutase / phosphoglucomutase